MNGQEFSDFSISQIKEMEKHKWIESEKAGRDLGQESCLEWIKLYAANFRTWWQSTHPEKK